MNTIYILFSIFAIGIFVGMTFGQTDSDDDFAIYLLPNDIKTKDLAKLDLTNLKLIGKPIIHQDDIYFYDRDGGGFTVKLSDSVERIKKMNIPTTGIPFVVAVGKTPIYTGAFWSNISSQSFEGITITISSITDQLIYLNLNAGYPSEQFFKGNDLRKDPRILKAFQGSGKIAEPPLEYDSFAIYLLPKKDKSKSILGDPNTYSLDEIKLTGKPFIHQKDIWYYNKDTRQIFTFPHGARELITMNYELITDGQKLSISGEGLPFVAVVGKVPIYTGAFWLNISKQGFSGITIIPAGIQGQFLVWQINYGYPREKFFQRDEFRNAINDSRIIKALEIEGKLYEDLEIIAKCKNVTPTGKRRQSFRIGLEVVAVTKGSFPEKEIGIELYDSPDNFDQVVEYEDYKVKKVDSEKLFQVKFEKQVTDKKPRLFFREAILLGDK